MDGPFMCVDPLGSSGLFVLGNVVHAIHETNVGRHPIIDKRFLPLLNNGIVKDPPITNFSQFISSAAEFFKGIDKAEHVGSMFAIRTVLPDKDETDERPTIVERAGDRVIKVFSGKIGTCVEAAEQVSRLVLGERLEESSEGMAKSSAQANRKVERGRLLFRPAQLRTAPFVCAEGCVWCCGDPMIARQESVGTRPLPPYKNRSKTDISRILLLPCKYARATQFDR